MKNIFKKEQQSAKLDFKPSVISEQFDMKGIMIKLHDAALKKATAKAPNGDYIIQNTAVDTSNGNHFYGAGQHEIIVICQDAAEKFSTVRNNNDKKDDLEKAIQEQIEIIKSTSVNIMTEYLHWFSNPNMNVSPDQLKPLLQDVEDEGKKKKPIKKDTKQNNKKDDTSIEKSSKDGSSTNGAQSDSGQVDSTNGKNDTQAANESMPSYVPSFMTFLKEENESSDKNDKPEQNVIGFALDYELKIDGMKYHKIADSMKKFIKNIPAKMLKLYGKTLLGVLSVGSKVAGKILSTLMKNASVSWTIKSYANAIGGGGDSFEGKISLEKFAKLPLAKITDKMFASIFGKHKDTTLYAEKILQAYRKEIRKEITTNEGIGESGVYSMNVIKHMLKKFKLSSEDKAILKKSFLKDAIFGKRENAICIRLNKNSATYSLFNKKLLAKVMNKAILETLPKSLKRFTKRYFLNYVSPDSIIYLNNYSDVEKRKDDSKLKNIDKNVGAVADSLVLRNIKPLIIEDIMNNILSEEDEQEDSKEKNKKQKQKTDDDKNYGSQERTDLDFYIIPIRGMKLENDVSDKEEK